MEHGEEIYIGNLMYNVYFEKTDEPCPVECGYTVSQKDEKSEEEAWILIDTVPSKDEDSLRSVWHALHLLANVSGE